MLTKTFPRACEFVNAWLEVQRLYKKKSSNLVHIFHHEDMVNNKEDFYGKLTEAVNIDTDIDTNNPLVFDKINNHNQRKGSTNEWKSFFSSGELDYIKKMLDKLIMKDTKLSLLWDVEGKVL